ncbi:MAG: hypothetical protein AUI14_12770 [Actinobacteria bacterium 13_2_20CM_2_71_6]|nr:MAG: hypothetical protein AUI14_12770 [Actinobacteria bacterium 13_2_20CM_2_71_6]
MLARGPRRSIPTVGCAKDTGRGGYPSRELAINHAWCTAAAITRDRTAWRQLLALDGELAVAEPNRLRYRILSRSPTRSAARHAAERSDESPVTSANVHQVPGDAGRPTREVRAARRRTRDGTPGRRPARS